MPGRVTRAPHPDTVVGRIVRRVSGHLTGLLAMAEDQPLPTNRVRLHPTARAAAGVPRLVVEHRHTARDLAARAHLVDRARRILRAAGALGCYVHPIETSSHAAGTLRMGADAPRPPPAPLGPRADVARRPARAGHRG